MRASLSFLLVCILAFFKTILAALFKTFGLAIHFLPSKPLFFHDHFTTQQSDFSSFLAVSKTEWASKLKYTLLMHSRSCLNNFVLRAFIFCDNYSQKTKEGVWAIWAIKFKKYVAGKYTHAPAPLVRKYTNWIFESKGGTTTMKIAN